MTVVETNPLRYTGLSSDSKPAGARKSAVFVETDTGVEFEWNGSSWVEIGRRMSTDLNASVLAALNIDDTDDHASSSVDLQNFDGFSPRIDFGTTVLTPTQVVVKVEWSEDDSTWYHYDDDAWTNKIISPGDITANDKIQLGFVEKRARYGRIVLTGTGTDGSNYFVVTTADIIAIRRG